jgi:autotransporter passenger strand-loop-strand repeat protein
LLFSGGIINQGKVNARLGSGIGVFGVTNFDGGILNTGSVAAGKFGVQVVGAVTSSGATLLDTFSGGIINTGKISAGISGIFVDKIASFGDGISNSGTISGRFGVFAEEVGSLDGGIVNSNTIVGRVSGIGLQNVSTFSGGITNAGTLSVALGTGFFLEAVTTFIGNIANTGAISARSAILIESTTINGAIVDTGTIKASRHGILIDSASEILASQTAVLVRGATFTAGISNSGVLSGTNGILIASAHSVSVFNAGAILASGGTAIAFAGSGNSLRLDIGATISGAVSAAGSNALTLGGTGSDSLDFAQFHGFPSATIVGGDWTVTGPGSGWVVSKGGALEVAGGAVFSKTIVKSGGTEVVQSGGTAVGVTVSSGGAIELLSGQVIQSKTLASGAIVAVGSGYVLTSAVASGLTSEVLSGGVVSGATFGSTSDKRLLIFSGGVASDVTIGSGGTATVFAGGTDDGADILKGGTGIVSSGGIDLGVVVNSGGTEIVSAGGVASNTTVSSGGVQMVASGGTADPTVILSGGTEVVNAHGTDLGAQISGGTQVVFGVASGATVFSGAQLVRVNANTGNALTIDVPEPIVNSGIMEATASGVNNTGGKIAALGKNAEVVVFAGSGIANGSGVISASGNGAHVDFDTRISGGTLRTTSGGVINSIGGAISGVTIASGSLVNVGNAETLQLYGTIANSGTIAVSATTSLTDLLVGSTTLTGGGKVQLSSAASGGESAMAAISAGTLLTNVNNTIFGAGGIGVGGDTSLTLVNSGTINANVNTTSGKLVIDLLNPISNAGLMEATNSGGLYLLSATIANTSAGSVVASGGKAEVILNDSTISGGILRTSGASAMILTDNFTSNNAIIGARIAAKSLIEAVSATLTVSGGTMSADAIVEAASNGTVVVSGTLVNSGGTVFASGVGGVVEIVSGAVVDGGIVEVGSGTVDIHSGGTANVVFLANASGGVLVIEDSQNNSSAFTGTVSGFGGVNHANHAQFIDLVSVTYAAGLITSSYVPANAANTSGTLFVSSGGVPVAAITMIGHYSAGNFVISGSGGIVVITDPTVPNGGSVAPGPTAAFPRQGIDLPNIAFGAQTTLALCGERDRHRRHVTVTDGRHAAAIALLGNYMAGSFVTAADGHGGTLISQAQAQQQPLLTHPPHG